MDPRRATECGEYEVRQVGGDSNPAEMITTPAPRDILVEQLGRRQSATRTEGNERAVVWMCHRLPCDVMQRIFAFAGKLRSEQCWISSPFRSGFMEMHAPPSLLACLSLSEFVSVAGVFQVCL